MASRRPPLPPQGRLSADTVPREGQAQQGLLLDQPQNAHPPHASSGYPLGCVTCVGHATVALAWTRARAHMASALQQGPATVDTSTSGLFMNSSVCRDKPFCIRLPWFP